MVDVVCALARYLRANPLACDSLEGISRWWLAAHPVTPEELMRALNWMKEQGLVEEIVAADGRLRYRRRAPEAMLDAAIEGYCNASETRH
jgi:Fe2+ or Zn2+ uptake regulation protein